MGNLKVFVLLAGNAFTTGRNGQNAVVCATEGLMKRVNRDELEGVIAHESAHVGPLEVGPAVWRTGQGNWILPRPLPES
jgi:hypothetical protein